MGNVWNTVIVFPGIRCNALAALRLIHERLIETHETFASFAKLIGEIGDEATRHT